MTDLDTSRITKVGAPGEAEGAATLIREQGIPTAS